MIKVGLTGWGDHPDLYPDPKSARNKLLAYSLNFPIVEVDSSFYAVQPVRNYEKWVHDTPDSFGFIVKAYQGMTGHLRGANPFQNQTEMFDAFLQSLQPVIQAEKLKAVLFQYPPWFDCTKANVEILRRTKEKMGDLPAALEFRNQTWFMPEMRDKTLQFMEGEGWIHSICDEPQAGMGSIPTVLHATSQSLTLVRFHGRNENGWNQNGQDNWREVRYLYRYTLEELEEWTQKLSVLTKASQEVCLLFNNNSGGDAAQNAFEMMRLLGIEDREQASKQGEKMEQIELFSQFDSF